MTEDRYKDIESWSETAVDKAVQRAVKKDRGEESGRSKLSPETVLAYISGRSTQAQRAEVQEALLHSSQLRQELVEMAESMDILEAPDTLHAFEQVVVPKAPRMADVPGLTPPRKASMPAPKASALPRFFQDLVARPALVAAALVAFIGYAGYREFVTLPRLARALRADRIASDTALTEAVRGESTEDMPVVTVAMKDTWVGLVLNINLTGVLESNMSCRFALMNQAKETMWSQESTAATLMHTWSHDEESLRLALPGALLTPGQFNIRATCPAGSGDRVDILFPFIVRRP